MRTNAVKEFEIRQLEALAERHRQHLRAGEIRLGPPTSPLPHRSDSGALPLLRHLLTLPIVTVREPEGPWTDAVSERQVHVVRDIQVDLSGEPVRYRLSEERVELNSRRPLRSLRGPEVVAESESAADILQAGYEAIAQDELSEKLRPILESGEARDAATHAPEDVAAVERILCLSSLAPDEQQRFRQEIAALLEGRIDPGEFVASAVKHDLPAPATYAGTIDGLRLPPHRPLP